MPAATETKFLNRAALAQAPCSPTMDRKGCRGGGTPGATSPFAIHGDLGWREWWHETGISRPQS